MPLLGSGLPLQQGGHGAGVSLQTGRLAPSVTPLLAWPLLGAGKWPRGRGSLRQELLLLPNLVRDGNAVRRTGEQAKGDLYGLHHGGSLAFQGKNG